ncbi:hypothetical protein BJ170DRAFT_176810 [Xylariales sp. AK1849]|nr:hypothetical protein BJ170DRAFT_176810 [Xylariales sp. AK1849]
MDMDGPALAPPDGVVPNLANPDNKNGLAWFVLVLCCVISTICVILRAYGRVLLLKTFKTEEVLILCAYGVFWGCAWASFSMIYTPGYFVHQWDVRLRDTIPMTYLVFVMGNTYVIVLMLLKVAMLSEWCRILVPRNMRLNSVFWWSCIVMISVQVAACVAIVIAMNLQCIPHQASWDFTVKGTCFPLYTLQLGSGIIYLASDIIMFCLPQRLIWKLQMSWKKRLGVSVVFGLGLLACVAAAFRLQVTIAYGHATDATYNVGDLIFWAMAEMTCGFFVICVPCIPKILHDTGIIRGIKRRLGMTTRATNPTRGYYGSTKTSGTGRKLPTTTTKEYYQLDEDSVPMGDIKSSESTEHLRQEKCAVPGRIIRTTRITVDESTDVNHRSDSEYVSQDMGSKGAWAI